MIPELGHYALILAWVIAGLQGILPLYGSYRDNLSYMQVAHTAALLVFLLIGCAFVCLIYSLCVTDFSVIYVANNANTALPLFYRIGATWGAHEGSLLLWVFILSGWSALVSVFSRSLPEIMRARVLAVMGWVAFCFLLFILLTSNPFLRNLTAIPANGSDLNPILQDPGLMFHPPMLYMGYVGLSVAFAFAIAVLLGGTWDSQWARWTRPWTLVSWSCLTLGITLGSWWSYRELGWGGWWFWDPVENASFMPWLVTTALIHSLMVAEKRNVFQAWTILLAISAFALSLLGTFLVRSGVLISVHAFATDPRRGLFLLLFLLAIVGGSLTLYALRIQRVQQRETFTWMSREIFLLGNNVLLMAAMGTVLLGTIYPLIVDALGWGKLSVGYPYFNAVFTPIMLPLLVLMGIGPLLHWRQTDAAWLRRRVFILVPILLILGCVLPFLMYSEIKWPAFISVVLAGWITINTVQYLLKPSTSTGQSRLRSRAAMVCAHLGMAVTVLGIGFVSAYSIEQNISLKPGEHTVIGPYDFKLANVVDNTGPNYSGVKADVEIRNHNQLLTVLHPEQRMFAVENIAVAKTDIQVGVFRDLYVALGTPLNDQAWAMRIYYKPFVRWIWAGGILMLVGGAFALLEKIQRPTRRVVVNKSSNEGENYAAN